MELSEYLAVLRRQWRTWVGLTVVGLGLGAAVFGVSPRTYEATARVFVSPQPSIANSAQYVQSRVQSYPGVVGGAAVLTPVIHDLGLTESVPELARTVTVRVPAGTSQLDISVTSGDPRSAAAVANAVAQQTTTVVEGLETPSSGVKPVSLTVSDPATVPGAPTSPRLVYDLALGLAVGLFLGLAVAVARGRRDTVLHDARDVHAAWGGAEELDVLSEARGGRGRAGGQAAGPASVLAHRLQLAAADRPVRVLLLSPLASSGQLVQRFADELVAALTQDGLRAEITDPDALELPTSTGPLVQVVPASPLAPPRTWRRFAGDRDGAVVLVPADRVRSQELSELRVLLRAAGVRALAAVVTSERGGGAASGGAPVTTADEQQVTGHVEEAAPAGGLPPVPRSADGSLPVS